MKIILKDFQKNPTNLLRQLGYQFQHHTSNNQMSFIYPLSQSGFPRFHIYLTLLENNLIFNIHLDQKKYTYGKTTRHHGEYKNEDILKKEIERIKLFFKSNS